MNEHGGGEDLGATVMATRPSTGIAQALGLRSVLAVCAHPDDESFGLGAVLSTLTGAGIRVRVLCFTHGEASTLGAQSSDLGAVRAAELSAAATVLGVESVCLLNYSDGGLADVPLDDLCQEIDGLLSGTLSDALLVFDRGGITGHPDHQRATESALAIGHRMSSRVLAWAIPSRVTAVLNREFDAGFVGRDSAEIDVQVVVDRALQRRAIACHASQASDNPVLWRRLDLMGDIETLRWLD